MLCRHRRTSMRGACAHTIRHMHTHAHPCNQRRWGGYVQFTELLLGIHRVVFSHGIPQGVVDSVRTQPRRVHARIARRLLAKAKSRAAREKLRKRFSIRYASSR